MSAFRHVLVPLDFSAKDDRSLEAAVRVATPGQTGVCLMHVVEAAPHAEDDPLVGFYKSLEENAKHKLKAIAAPLRDMGLDVDTCVSIGRPARKIVDEAQQSGADLLVLSSHPLGDTAHDGMHWATVSYQAAIFCRCPVLLVK